MNERTPLLTKTIEVDNECMSRSSSQSTEMETSLFRPFDEPKSNTQQSNVKSRTPVSDFQERASRPLIRSERRSQSKSIPRALPRTQLEKPVSINSQTVIKDSPQQSASRKQDTHLENPMTKNNNTEPRQQTITNSSR